MYRTYLIVLAVFLWGACSQEASESSQEKEASDQKPSSGDKAVMHEDSELVVWMKQMHDQMFVVREHLEKGEPVPDSINWNWEAIYEAERSNDDAQGETFNVMAKSFLDEMNRTLEKNDLKSYNHAVRTCVNCHENYCPGPIPKIKKLKISESGAAGEKAAVNQSN